MDLVYTNGITTPLAASSLGSAMVQPVILSIDTSDYVLGVELTEGGAVTARRIVDEPRVHSAQLVPSIIDILDGAGRTAADIAAVAVAKGPGSYTGLRIGVSTAKGLAFSLGIPLIGVPTMEAIATALGPRRPAIELITCLRSRKGEVYVQRWDVGVTSTSITDVVAIPLTQIPALVSQKTRPEVFVVGSGTRDFLDAAGGAEHLTAIETDGSLAVHGVAMQAEWRFRERAFDKVDTFEPYYLKEFVATVGASPFEAARKR